VMADHVAWLEVQHGSGAFLVSGPSGVSGGVILARGDDRAEVEALAASDPLARAGVASYEIVQFRASQSAPGVDAFT
jgi:uncharacterized protein YciI